MKSTVKEIKVCVECGADFAILRHRGPREKCARCRNRAIIRRWKAANPERKRELNKESRARRAEHRREYDKKYQQEHPEVYSSAQRRFRERNEERVKEIRRDYYARHRDLEIQRVTDRNKAQRTPAWADRDAIAAIYAEARRLSRETGVPHHVDHIVPLRGKEVSGLHVETNLQILTRSANISKGNKLVQTGIA